jgi:WD40 repeat protein
VVCRRLWNHLPAEDDRIGLDLVERYGEVGEALGEFYAESVAQVAETTDVSERDIRVWFDEHLITKRGIRGQVLQEPGQSAGLEDEAISELIDMHVVRAETRRGAVWFELAHDRLIEPIQANNDAWYQVNLNAFQQQARLWESQGRVPGYLLADEALAQAEKWASAQARLTDTERDYIEESIQHQRAQDAERRLLEEARARQQAEEGARREAEQRVAEQVVATRKIRRWLRIAGVLGVLALILLVVAGFNWQTANVNALRTRANLALSEQLRGDNELGALLARQAYLGRSGLLIPASLPEVDPALGRLLGADHFSHIFRGHRGSVLEISFDATGDRLASAGDDGTVRLWDLRNPATPGRVLDAAHRSGADVVAFQPGGPWVASAGDDRQVLLQDPGSELPTLRLSHEKAVRTIVFDPDRHLLATAGREGCLRLWDLDRPDVPSCTYPPDIPRDPAPAIRMLALRPGGAQLFSADTRGNIFVWDLGESSAARGTPAAKRFVSLDGQAAVWGLAFAPQGDSLASVGKDGKIRLWNPDHPGSVPTVLGTGLGFLRSVAFSPDGLRLASGGDDGIVRIWDVKTPDDPREILQGHHGPVNSVAFDPADRWLASAGVDGTIRLWELNDPTAFLPAGEPVTAMDLGPGGATIATSIGADGHVQIRDLNQPELLPIEVDPKGGMMTALTFDAKGQRLATGNMNGSVRIWDLTRSPPTPTDRELQHEDRVTDLAFSPDGRWLVSSGVDESVIVWDTAHSDRIAEEARGDPQGVNTVVFHPEGRWLAAAGSEGDIAIWTDLTNFARQPETTFPAHEGRAIDMAIDPQGRWLASAGYDGTIKLWRLDDIPIDPDDPDPTPDRILTAEEGGIISISFSRDGNTLASAGNDGAIRLWDLNRPESDAQLLISDELTVSAIAFSESGELVVRSGDVVHLWNTSLEFLAEAVCDRVWRNLTDDEWAKLIGTGANERTCDNHPLGS